MADKNKRKLITRDIQGRRTDRVKMRERERMKGLHDSGRTAGEIATILKRKPETVKRHLDLMSMPKAPQQDEMAQTVPKDIIPEIIRLAKRIEQLAHVPNPEKQLLPRESLNKLPFTRYNCSNNLVKGELEE